MIVWATPIVIPTIFALMEFGTKWVKIILAGEQLIEYAASIGFKILNLEFSPVKGPEGNIEYLLHLQKISQPEEGEVPLIVENVVEKAHEVL